MADASWQELTAPLQRASGILRSSAAVLRELGNEREFLRLLQVLNSLPGAATFRPFDSTRQWQVELAAHAAAPAQEQAKPDEAFIERMKKTPARPEPLKVVTEGKAATANRDGRDNSEDTAIEAGLAGTAQGRETEQAAVAGKAGSASEPGAWLALERIAELTRELEQQGSAPAAQPPAAPWTGPGQPLSRTEAGPSRQQETPAAAIRQSGSRPAPAAVTRQATVANVPKAGTEGTKQRGADPPPSPVEEQDGFALLNQYVDVLFQASARGPESGSATAQAEPGRSRSSNPAAASATIENPAAAPRAPSLLLAGTEAPGADPSGKNSKEALAARRNETTTTAAKTGEIAGDPGDRGHESPEERVNRTLKEQAWLRGGDLT